MWGKQCILDLWGPFSVNQPKWKIATARSIQNNPNKATAYEPRNRRFHRESIAQHQQGARHCCWSVAAPIAHHDDGLAASWGKVSMVSVTTRAGNVWDQAKNKCNWGAVLDHALHTAEEIRPPCRSIVLSVNKQSLLDHWTNTQLNFQTSENDGKTKQVWYVF